MFSLETKNSRVDPYILAKDLQGVKFDIEVIDLIQTIETIAFIILGVTLSLSAAQKKYLPLMPAFEEGIQIISLAPLPIVIFFEGLRQSALIANEINGTLQSTN